MDTAQAGQMLEQAQWAAHAFAGYDYATVQNIVEAVAHTAAEKAEFYAEWAVRETGMGVVAHKVLKNMACSSGLLDYYQGADFVTPRTDTVRKITEVPRPAGVVLAITPTTNPTASVYFKTLLSLMTRNAVVIAPHPYAKEVCADAARTLAEAAVAAGAPKGVIQVIDEPSIPLLQALMHDPRTDVIVATGGSDVVRAAYSSGNPALGVGPGNVPILVDATADLPAAARRIVDSKAFDNSVLCTNESVLIAEDAIHDKLGKELERAGAYVLDDEAGQRLRSYMFLGTHLNTEVVGKSAAWIAEKAGLRVGPKTRCLVVPVPHVVPEDSMTHEKLSPVLGFVRVPDVDRGIAAARSVVRIGGAGHSAAVHSEDARVVMEFTARVPVLRVAVNVGNSTGSSGIGTHLPPSMTLGTGFIGGSSIGENLEPRHLVNWARIAYNSEESVQMPSFATVSPWQAPAGPVPRYPHASNNLAASARSGGQLADRVLSALGTRLPAGSTAGYRDEIRELVRQELAHLMKG